MGGNIARRRIIQTYNKIFNNYEKLRINYRDLQSGHSSTGGSNTTVTASRLKISTESLKDIATDNSKSIRAQALRIAAEDAKKINIVTTRQTLTDQAVEYLSKVIDNSQQVVHEALHLGKEKALDYTAFVVNGDKIELSAEWLADQERQRLIDVSTMRGRVLQQFDEVRRAVEALNALVACNKNYKMGLLPAGTRYRTIATIDEDGKLELHSEALDFLG